MSWFSFVLTYERVVGGYEICKSNTKQSKNITIVLNHSCFFFFPLSLVTEFICFLYHMNKYSIKY